MKSFALALTATLATAQGFGTTGHYGNAFAGVGKKDHANGDHMYGYDAVASRSDLKTGGTGAANNLARTTAINTAVDLFNKERTDYLEQVRLRRLQRL